MELNSIIEYLENKSILVTGSTGFLAKIFVEKVLRVQPKVKRLYLLIRATDTKTAIQRFHNEVIAKEIFGPLRRKLGTGFDTFITNKVMPLAGDVTMDHLGIEDPDLRERLWLDVNVIVNSAANTKFDERYDVALGINTFGAKHVLEFAQKCVPLEVFLHISTAFVCGERTGIVLEKAIPTGSLNGISGLDIEEEMKLVSETVTELRAKKTSKDLEKMVLKKLGIKRATLYGWPNTYVFTKALGEMLIRNIRGKVPVVIVRPSVVTSTYKEPFPGWVEGVRTIDSVIAGYGKGKLTCFLVDPESILDMIPGDMVVNAMIVAVTAHANQSVEFIYHVGSSTTNPVNSIVLRDYSYNHFSKNPWITKDGKHIIVKKKARILTTKSSFHRYMVIHYIFPLKGLKLLNAIVFQLMSPIYNDLNKKINLMTYLVKLYEPYVFFKGTFDDQNTERLRMATKAEDVDIFYFSPKCIDWEDYFVNIHLPGFVKYVLNGQLSR